MGLPRGRKPRVVDTIKAGREWSSGRVSSMIGKEKVLEATMMFKYDPTEVLTTDKDWPR
jgi:hypothetical protein